MIFGSFDKFLILLSWFGFGGVNFCTQRPHPYHDGTGYVPFSKGFGHEVNIFKSILYYKLIFLYVLLLFTIFCCLVVEKNEVKVLTSSY
jgi:hypothetical protein